MIPHTERDQLADPGYNTYRIFGHGDPKVPIL